MIANNQVATDSKAVAADRMAVAGNRVAADGASAVQSERPTAWSLWRNHSRLESEGMAASEADRSRMIERHKLVVNIIEINSQQLRCESAKAGLDFERACAQRDAALPGASPEARAHLAALERKMEALAAEGQRLESQREFLNATLSEFDGAASNAAEPVGRA